MKDVRQVLHYPDRREIAIRPEHPLEKHGVSYMVAFRDGDKFRAWRRAIRRYPPISAELNCNLLWISDDAVLSGRAFGPCKFIERLPVQRGFRLGVLEIKSAAPDFTRDVFVPPTDTNVMLSEQTHEMDDGDLPPAPKKILILDDDPALGDSLKLRLEGDGFQVACVTSGVDGLKLVMGEKFDVVVCDMVMPNMPGDMFYKAVERTKPYLTKRFIFITGHAGNPDIDQFIRSVRGLMLWKPFEHHQLLEAVEAVLKKAEAG